MNGVPINFQISSDAHAPRGAGSKYVGQIEKNCLLPACGKAQIVLRRDPATVSVGNFQAQPMSAPALALRDCDVHRRLSVVDRSLCDQIERAALRSIVAEIDFKIVIPRDALILAASEARQGFPVE